MAAQEPLRRIVSIRRIESEAVLGSPLPLETPAACEDQFRSTQRNRPPSRSNRSVGDEIGGEQPGLLEFGEVPAAVLMRVVHQFVVLFRPDEWCQQDLARTRGLAGRASHG